MPYYRGDYYRGDYYRGDPFLGGIFKTIAGGVKGFITGGPLGALTGAAAAATGAKNLPVPMITPPISSFAPTGGGGVQVVKGTPGAIQQPGWTGTINRFLPGGQTGYELPMRGYHLNKAFVRGRPKVPETGYVHEIVRNRRMNVTNPRALRRAIVRASGFAKLARRVLTFVEAKAPKGRARFKRRRR